MSESLSQALGLTLLGMGMTFGAILILILFMYLMTYLTRQRTTVASMSADNEPVTHVGEEIAEEKYGDEESTSPGILRRRRAAAAAAVAALALGQRVLDVKPVDGVERDAAWDAYMRTRHLSQRMRYESKKRL
jgi:Na+-transporting methylmalonyl-CoA/oxaloacetate decarboxylase gamma subunit